MQYKEGAIPMGVLPRMKAFDQDRLGRLIMSDTVGLDGQLPRRIFGAGKVCMSVHILTVFLGMITRLC